MIRCTDIIILILRIYCSLSEWCCPLLASAKVKSTFSVYSRVRSASGLTGADAARRILRMSGITDVTVVPISGSLTDHYDPGSKKLALSQDVYDKTSVAAIGVAAHECGHAIQHATNYVPLIFALRLCLLQTSVPHFPGHCFWQD